MPSGPVQALALPLLATIAHALPDFACFMLNFTGAAFTWFVVNVAATVAGLSETMSAMSLSPEALIPPARPAARNPRGAVTQPSTRLHELFMAEVPSFPRNRIQDSSIVPP